MLLFLSGTIGRLNIRTLQLVLTQLFDHSMRQWTEKCFNILGFKRSSLFVAFLFHIKYNVNFKNGLCLNNTGYIIISRGAEGNYDGHFFPFPDILLTKSVTTVTCNIGMLHSSTHMVERSDCTNYRSAIVKRFGLVRIS